MGPVLVCTVWGLVGVVVYIYFGAIVPLLGWSVSSWPGLPVSAVGVSLLGGIVYNHTHAVFTDPGRIPEDVPVPANIDELIAEEQRRVRGRPGPKPQARQDHHSGLPSIGGATYAAAKKRVNGQHAGEAVEVAGGAGGAEVHVHEQQVQQRVQRGGRWTMYCAKCRKPKPPRTHHCHACGRCVLKMDHHCPWIANCVGHHNLVFFYRFMLFIWVGCAFIIFTGGLALVYPTIGGRPLKEYSQSPFEVTLKADDSALDTPPLTRAEARRSYRAYKHTVLFSVILTSSAFLALTVMIVLHTYLILSNQTTIEMHENRSRRRVMKARGEIFINPYDLGRKKNWEQVFGVGKYFFSWLLPGVRSPGRGLKFPTCTYDHDDALQVDSQV